MCILLGGLTPVGTDSYREISWTNTLGHSCLVSFLNHISIIVEFLWESKVWPLPNRNFVIKKKQGTAIMQHVGTGGIGNHSTIVFPPAWFSYSTQSMRLASDAHKSCAAHAAFQTLRMSSRYCVHFSSFWSFDTCYFFNTYTLLLHVVSMCECAVHISLSEEQTKRKTQAPHVKTNRILSTKQTALPGLAC
jgi:hypothetical protein